MHLFLLVLASAGRALASRWCVPSRLLSCKPFHRKRGAPLASPVYDLASFHTFPYFSPTVTSHSRSHALCPSPGCAALCKRQHHEVQRPLYALVFISLMSCIPWQWWLPRGLYRYAAHGAALPKRQGPTPLSRTCVVQGRPAILATEGSMETIICAFDLVVPLRAGAPWCTSWQSSSRPAQRVFKDRAVCALWLNGRHCIALKLEGFGAEQAEPCQAWLGVWQALEYSTVSHVLHAWCS